MAKVETTRFSDSEPGVAKSSYRTISNFSPDGTILNKTIDEPYNFSPSGTVPYRTIDKLPWYPEWYGERVSPEEIKQLHHLCFIRDPPKVTKQRVHMNVDSGRDVGLRLEEGDEIYLNGDFESIADNTRGRIYWDNQLVGARPYAVEMSKIEKYMEDTIPTRNTVNDVLRKYKGESVVRRFLAEAEICITGAKKGLGQFLRGTYSDKEKKGAEELVKEFPEYAKIWYNFAEQFVELEGKNGRDIDLEEIRKEFPHIEEIL